MFNLSKEPFLFQKQTTHEIWNQLAHELPINVEVTVDDSKHIKIHDGLWRGARLQIDTSLQQAKLVGIQYFIPSFLAKIIIFICSVAAFSLSIMIALTIVLGKFIPVFSIIGGIAGFAVYSVVERIFIAKIKKSWSIELYEAIEKLKA